MPPPLLLAWPLAIVSPAMVTVTPPLVLTTRLE
jgi:hypothetical protein